MHLDPRCILILIAMDKDATDENATDEEATEEDATEEDATEEEADDLDFSCGTGGRRHSKRSSRT